MLDEAVLDVVGDEEAAGSDAGFAAMEDKLLICMISLL
jgi:hypothetical protein